MQKKQPPPHNYAVARLNETMEDIGNEVYSLKKSIEHALKSISELHERLKIVEK